MTTFFDDRAVLTPLGPAMAIGLLDDTDEVEWITYIKATGEPWFFRNPHVRFINTATDGRPDVSPFTDLGPKLERQVKRYKQKGWIP